LIISTQTTFNIPIMKLFIDVSAWNLWEFGRGFPQGTSPSRNGGTTLSAGHVHAVAAL